MRHVKSAEELIPTFAVPPAGKSMGKCFFARHATLRSGPTPIVRVLRHVLQEKQLEIQERKLLLLIATDGVPTNDQGQQDIKSLEQTLRHERKPISRIPVTIIACTDDTASIGYVAGMTQGLTVSVCVIA